ncbi:unnamed protein product [Dibothriocephalus latus]|uniref:SMC hinge domain-containing protein n=1 Tax=Dibothriocephalus latus TaxID=60516 RepID=A0A3P7LLA1_DIBLA|nr:unnamed protein product [Dibothriocephalus latus]
MQLTCADYSATLRSGKSARERAAEELARVNSQIELVEQRLTELKPEYKASRQKEDDIANALRRSCLPNKVISKDDDRKTKLQEDLTVAEENINCVRTELETVSEDSRRLRREKDEIQTDRQTVYREETKIAQELNNWRDELARTEHSLRSITGKVILNGLDSCPEDFYTSVEVTAGSRLFYHVVQNDKYVIRIIAEINKHNLPGEVHFLPINRLSVKEFRYPETEGAIPMISRLKFDEKFRPVMLHIFGKTLICSSIDVAAQLARRQNFDCITLDGDQVSRKGTLTGGYYDNRLSRLELQRRKQKTEMEIQETENVRENNAKRKEQVDAQINRIIDELQRKETVRSKLESDKSTVTEELRTKTEGRPQKERKLASLRHDLDHMKYTMESYKVELGTDLLSQLSVQEQREVDRLNDKIQELTRDAKESYK